MKIPAGSTPPPPPNGEPPPPLPQHEPPPPTLPLVTGVFTSQSAEDDDDDSQLDNPPPVPHLVTGVFATQSTAEDDDDDFFRDFAVVDLPEFGALLVPCCCVLSSRVMVVSGIARTKTVCWVVCPCRNIPIAPAPREIGSRVLQRLQATYRLMQPLWANSSCHAN